MLTNTGINLKLMTVPWSSQICHSWHWNSLKRSTARRPAITKSWMLNERGSWRKRREPSALSFDCGELWWGTHGGWGLILNSKFSYLFIWLFCFKQHLSHNFRAPKMEADELKLRVKQLEEELQTLRAQRWGWEVLLMPRQPWLER